MNATRIVTIARLELLQRVRTASWYILLGVFAVLLLGVTALAFLSYGGIGAGTGEASGAGIYSIVVYFTLLLVLLVSPTLSGNSINGDRDAATLAPVQVTLATTGDILIGKFLAAWVTGLAFTAVAVPFLVIATFAGGVQPLTVIVSLLVLILETAIVAAIGVALSGILARPLFSVATTYLVVAALAAGTVIGFGLVGTAFSSTAVSHNRSPVYDMQGNPVCQDGVSDCATDPAKMLCGEWESYEYRVPRFDYVWWMLSANPFVVLADATPTTFDAYGNPQDAFGWLTYSIRGAQLPPELEQRWDGCAAENFKGSVWDDADRETPQEVMARTLPSWFVGLTVQVLLAALLMWRAFVRTGTPARRLPPGTRIA